MGQKSPIKTLFIGHFPKDIIKERLGISPLFISVQDAKDINQTCLENLKDAQAIISRSGCLFEEPMLRHAPKLKLLIKAGAGTDMINHDYCKKKNITVLNTPGTNAQSVSELAIGFIIALSRHIIPLQKSMEQEKWLRSEYVGTELSGKHVAVIGYGYVGRRTVKLLKAFNCSITIHDPTMTKEEKDHAILDGCLIETCENCSVKQADFIVLHPSYNPTSHHFINQKKIGKMKKGVKIINLARGNVMDQEATLEGLKNGIIGGLAIDCWWEEPPKNNPFKDFENVIMTPHVGANTEEALNRSTAEAINLIEKYDWKKSEK